MVEKTPKNKLRLIFADILKGYSLIYNKKYKDLYIKHLTPFDIADMDIKTDSFLEYARRKGLPTTEEKETQLNKDGIWTTKNEKELKDKKFYLEGLNLTLTKLFGKDDKENINNQIKETSGQILKMELEKQEFIGYTADTFASRKVNEYFMFNSLFKDPDQKLRLFSYDEFEELEEEDINSLIDSYNASNNNFNTLNLQRIALSPFFLNIYYLCDDNVMNFWGKPIIKLSSFQIDLTSQAKYFKNMLSNLPSRPSDEMLDNPDKLVEWYNSSQNLDKTLKKTETGGEGGGTGVIGVNSEELKNITSGEVKVADAKFFANLRKQGKGRIKMDEFINMSGG